MSDELFMKYMQRGGGESLGEPLDAFEQVVQDKQGFTGLCRNFVRGSIYWSQNTGAWIVEDKILEYWKEKGAQKSELGYPISDQKEGSHNIYSRFQRGIIFYIPDKNECKELIGRRDSQVILRRVATFIVIVFFIIIAIYFNVASCQAKYPDILGNGSCNVWTAGVIPTGIAMLGPISGIIIRFAWPSSNAYDDA